MRLSQFKFAQIYGTVYQNSLSVILVFGVLLEGKPLFVFVSFQFVLSELVRISS